MDRPNDPNLHNKLIDADKRLRQINRRLTRVCDSLSGSRPETGQAGADPKSISSGVHERLDRLHTMFCIAEEEITRIETAVGVELPPQVTTASGY